MLKLDRFMSARQPDVEMRVVDLSPAIYICMYQEHLTHSSSSLLADGLGVQYPSCPMAEAFWKGSQHVCFLLENSCWLL